MATLSTVAVDFIANTAKYIAGLQTMTNANKKWSSNTKKDTQGATDAFNGTSRAFDALSKRILAFVAVERLASTFSNAAREVSLLADEAQKVGARAEDFAKFELAAKRNGASLNDVKTGFKELQKSINEAVSGTETATRAFLDLGLSYTNLAKIDPSERFLQIAEALSKVQDANKRAELGTILLGKAYTELRPLIETGRAGITRAGAGALGGTDIAAIDKVTKSFEQLGVVLDTKVKQILVELSPALLKIADALQFLVTNVKSFALVFAIAFSPKPLQLIADKLILVAQVISFQLIKNLQIATTAAAGTARAMAAIASVEIYTRLAKLNSAILLVVDGLNKFVKNLRLVLSVIGLVAIAFEVVTRVIEKAARLLGFEGYADGLKMIREEVEDFVLGFLGFETAADKVKEFERQTAERLDAARKRFEAAAQSKQELDDRLGQDTALANFRKTLQDITKLPLPQRLNELIVLFDKLNAGLDPVRQKELADAFNDIDDELSKLVDTGLDELDVGRARIRQAEELNAAVRRGITDEQTARAIQTSRALRDAALYDESLAILVKARDITNNSLLVDKEKAERIKTIGQSYVDLIEPIGAVERQIKTLNSLQFVKSITPEQRKSLEDYYKLQLRSSQVALTGNNVLESGQKYIETLQQINILLPANSDNVEILRMRTMALKSAEVQRFTEVTPYFREIAQFGQQFADGLANAIVEGQNFGDALKSVFKSVLRDIAVLTLRMLILQGIMAAIGFINPVAGAAFGTMVGLPPGRAKGGPVGAGMPYTVGEEGPEVFVPSENGYIVPNDMMAGESIVVNQTINIETGVSQTVRAEMVSLLPKFRQEAIASVLDAKLRGGSYAKGLVAA
jgi:hypothetical protein